MLQKASTYKEYCYFDHSDFPAHSTFTFDVCWGSLGTSILGNSSWATSNTLDPDYLSDYLSVSYDYEHIEENNGNIYLVLDPSNENR